MRYEDGSVRVVTENEFINEFLRRANDPYWMKVQSIQTTVKAKIGLGKPFIFTFNAPCFKKEHDEEPAKPLEGDLVFDY